MNIQRFKELIEAYGTRSERWPEADRHAALIFLESDRDAIEIINELRRLDEALDADIVAQSTNLKADILHQISLTTVNRMRNRTGMICFPHCGAGSVRMRTDLLSFGGQRSQPAYPC